MDPFSAASGTVGIISLGIQVCQGLVSYYNNWKDYPEDISRAYNSITDLTRVLELLRTSLKNEKLDIARREQVENSIKSCEDGIHRLSTKLLKFNTNHTTPNPTKPQAWSNSRRVLYPFKRSTIEKLQEIISDLQTQLGLAIQILQLDADIASLDKLDEMDSNILAIGKAVSGLSLKNEERSKAEELSSLRRWLSPTEPETIHLSARQSHEAQTGLWLLQSKQYQDWKIGHSVSKHIWLHGFPGSGKSVLCSTVIEDVRQYCTQIDHAVCAIFYFTFSDESKQSYGSLLRSVLFQLASKELGFNTLLEAHKAAKGQQVSDDTLENVLYDIVGSYQGVFLLVDALDESPETNQTRQTLLSALERLDSKLSNLRIFVTSREQDNIQATMEALQAESISMSSKNIDPDIRKHVAMQLSSDRRLVRLDATMKERIVEVISGKADGMFRWAYCQIDALRGLKSTKPKYVQQVLESLPPTLDATYERILSNIEPMFRAEMFVLLRWLAYATWPLTLVELAEASIVDPYSDVPVDVVSRGSLEDVLRLLAGLITVHSDVPSEESIYGTMAENRNEEETNHHWLKRMRELVDYENPPGAERPWSQDSSQKSLIRLAHFSVKEYLESDRILLNQNRDLQLQPNRDHEFLAKSCMAYFKNIADSSFGGKLQQRKHSSAPLSRKAAAWPLFVYTFLWWTHNRKLLHDKNLMFALQSEWIRVMNVVGEASVLLLT